MVQVLALEENLSISTGLATRPSRLSPKKCINKSIWLATGGAPSMGTPRVPSGCQQIDLFMHFLGARVLMASVEMDKISSSVCRTKTMHQLLRFKSKFPNHFVFTLGCYLFLLFLVHFI